MTSQSVRFVLLLYSVDKPNITIRVQRYSIFCCMDRPQVKTSPNIQKKEKLHIWFLS